MKRYIAGNRDITKEVHKIRIGCAVFLGGLVGAFFLGMLLLGAGVKLFLWVIGH